MRVAPIRACVSTQWSITSRHNRNFRATSRTTVCRSASEIAAVVVHAAGMHRSNRRLNSHGTLRCMPQSTVTGCRPASLRPPSAQARRVSTKGVLGCRERYRGFVPDQQFVIVQQPLPGQGGGAADERVRKKQSASDTCTHAGMPLRSGSRRAAGARWRPGTGTIPFCATASIDTRCQWSAPQAALVPCSSRFYVFQRFISYRALQHTVALFICLLVSLKSALTFIYSTKLLLNV